MVPSTRRLPWQPIVILLITLILVAWFLRGVDLREMARTLEHASPGWIAVSVLAVFGTYLARGWRWQVLLAPIGGASFRASFRVTVMGFTATNLLPGRLGEILRPYLISKQTPVKMGSALVTILIERLMDMACVILLFGIFLLTTPIDVGASVKTAGAASLAAAIAGLTLLVFGASRPDTLRRWSVRAAGWLPARASAGAQALAERLIEGLRVLRDPGAVLRVFLWSLVLWLAIAVSIWSACRAVALDVPVTGAFLITMYLVVGVAVPVPAGVGSYHFMFQLAAVGVFGAPRELAAAAAILAHAVSFLPISVLGLVYLAQDGWTLTRLRAMRPDGGSQ